MLDQKNNLSKNEIDEFLYAHKIGTLSLTDQECAYGIPLAYSYDGKDIYLALLYKGRKIEYIKKSKKVCFSIFWAPQDIGIGRYSWISIICDGELEHLIDRENIEKAVRVAEKNMNLPHGTWDKLIHRADNNPEKSMFWRLNISSIGARSMG